MEEKGKHYEDGEIANYIVTEKINNNNDGDKHLLCNKILSVELYQNGNDIIDYEHYIGRLSYFTEGLFKAYFESKRVILIKKYKDIYFEIRNFSFMVKSMVSDGKDLNVLKVMLNNC